ncbi:MAG: ACP S-malonyltransferase [Ignavibacteria bacterium]|nr:ACP S-malonyltransferase [Ignavibacteria bacterium]
MTALVFPGQGAQFVGMGKDLYESFSECRKVFDEADEILKFKLSEVCFYGPEEKLKQTENTQPSLFVHSLAVLQLIKNIQISAAAGHSLGEYSALTASGVMNFSDALKVVRKRGELMQESGVRNPGTMAAIVGLSYDKLNELCESAKTEGIVQPANFNSPDQVVVSGSIAGVRKLVELAKANGAKLAKQLIVSGAFHSPLMNFAYENISNSLESVQLNKFNFPVYSNVTAEKFENENEIKNLLVQQIISPVQWEKIIVNMIRDGIQTFIEIGSGKVLSGLIKRIDPAVETLSLGTKEEIEKYLSNAKSN